MKRYAKLAARLRVPSGFLAAVLYVIFSDPTSPSLAVGLPVASAGLLLRAWAAGHVAKNEQLATTGPFAYTRNPLYLGTLITATGFAIAARNVWLAVVFGFYFLAVYLPVILAEEDHLRVLFPEYPGYAARVPRLRPRLRPARIDAGRFQWRLYIRNREYEALGGFLAGAALLAAKLHSAVTR
jgi:protein-S-isoprenylcysteine O-methyltransferase Ste14